MIERSESASWATRSEQETYFLDPGSESSAEMMSAALWRLEGGARLDAAPAASAFPAVLDLSTLDGANGVRLFGVDVGDESGSPVSSAGDVNGDGFDDIIIGAPSARVNGEIRAGESYVVFGRASGIPASFDLATLDGTNGFRLDGVDADDQSGASVSSAGDVNGDGFDDIIIGAGRADPEGVYSGASYIVFGHGGGFRRASIWLR